MCFFYWHHVHVALSADFKTLFLMLSRTCINCQAVILQGYNSKALMQSISKSASRFYLTFPGVNPQYASILS